MARTYEAIQKNNSSAKAESRFVDLKSRKQISGLDQKVIHYNNKENSPRVFTFTSSRRSEGVTTVFANFVNYFKDQHSNKKILLVDANLHAPCLHKIFGVQNSLGILECFKDMSQFSEVATQIDSTNMFLLPCEGDSQCGSSTLPQAQMATLLDESRKQYDFVFIDSAPTVSSSDGLTTAIVSDVTFLIIQSLKVQLEVARKAKTLLHDNECLIGGVILNKVQQVIPEWMYRVI